MRNNVLAYAAKAAFALSICRAADAAHRTEYAQGCAALANDIDTAADHLIRAEFLARASDRAYARYMRLTHTLGTLGNLLTD